MTQAIMEPSLVSKPSQRLMRSKFQSNMQWQSVIGCLEHVQRRGNGTDTTACNIGNLLQENGLGFPKLSIKIIAP